MRTTGMRALAAVLCLAAAVTAAEPAAAKPKADKPKADAEKFDREKMIKAGFVSLFNGRDLTGWKVPKGDNGHWKVVDGVIDYDARSEARGSKNLQTAESFGDFSLHIEWRLKKTSGLYPMPTILPDGTYKKDANGKVIKKPTPTADSGIFLRGWAKAQVNIWCWPCGSGEMWGIRNDAKLPAKTRAGAVPKLKADEPVGQWNAFDITLKKDRVTIVLNGQTVIDNAHIPGIPQSGPITLQHHGGPNKKTGKLSPASSLIQFRNIFIKRFEAAPAGEDKGDTKPAPDPTTLTEAAGGKTVAAAVGQAITVRLRSNPSTGYSWAKPVLKGTSVVQSGEMKYTARPARGMVGAGGTAAVPFKAVARGTTTITMHYRRPWEKGKAPARTFTVTIEVK